MIERRSGRRSRRTPRFKGLSFSRLVPNMITIGATCAALTGVRFALDGKWEHAAAAIVVAAILDALDGRMARLLKSASEFGAELDSLSDFAAFGVSPALILYFWSLHALGGVGWAVALFLAVCCGLRLARFNSSLGKLPPYAYNYFTGVPAPAGAGLAILPMIVTFAFGLDAAVLSHPVGIAVWSVLVALLMVSNIPTYAVKKVKVPHVLVIPVLLGALLFVGGLASEPWLTLTFAGAVYVLLIPLSVFSYSRLKAEAERMHAKGDGEEPAGAPADGVTPAPAPEQVREQAREQAPEESPEKAPDAPPRLRPVK